MSKYRALTETYLEYLLQIVTGKEKNFPASIILLLLTMLSKIYGSLLSIRIFLYKHSIFRRKTFGCLTISVGNITVGGTGKTPIVEILAKALKTNGRKVAILSRGYKKKEAPLLKRLTPSHLFTPKYKVVADDESIILNARDAGDEPYMLAKNLPETVIMVGKNRIDAAEHAVTKFKVDTLILDDGFQYFPFKRNLDIVLIDVTNPFGNNFILPRGTLREPIKNLKRANLFFLTKVPENPDMEDRQNLQEIQEILYKINPNAGIIECTHKPLYLNNIGTQKIVDLSYFKNKNISVISGIAQPESFKKALEQLGAKIIKSYHFPDHHRYTHEEITTIIKKSGANKTQAIITTEKDAVRIPKTIKHAIPFLYLRVEIKILKGTEIFNDYISKFSF